VVVNCHTLGEMKQRKKVEKTKLQHKKMVGVGWFRGPPLCMQLLEVAGD
jgi:hypothetical protein